MKIIYNEQTYKNWGKKRNKKAINHYKWLIAKSTIFQIAGVFSDFSGDDNSTTIFTCEHPVVASYVSCLCGGMMVWHPEQAFLLIPATRVLFFGTNSGIEE
ncbi:MAG: hypothetical protein IPN18_07180 [Ignavibacteriales bacterium]|nr:hypothetical protein [Ignavibacteriales bacterium]